GETLTDKHPDQQINGQCAHQCINDIFKDQQHGRGDIHSKNIPQGIQEPMDKAGYKIHRFPTFHPYWNSGPEYFSLSSPSNCRWTRTEVRSTGSPMESFWAGSAAAQNSHIRMYKCRITDPPVLFVRSCFWHCCCMPSREGHRKECRSQIGTGIAR